MRAQRRLGYLDTMRGLAACAVFFSHCIYTCGFPSAILALQNYLPIHFIFDGHSAVGLFFVLSGLVLSLRFLQEGKGPELFRFYAARMIRIYPAFLGALAVTILVRELVVRYGTLSSFWSSPVTWSSFFEQALLVIPSNSSRLLKQDWSLEWELKFSLVVPILIFLIRRGLGVFLVCVAVGLWGLKIEKYLFHFALGVAIASSWDSLQQWFHARSSFFRWGWGLAGLYLYAFRYTPPLNLPFVSNSDLQWYIGAMGSGMCLIGVAGSHSVRHFLERAPMLWLGERSYSFFLVHYSVLLSLTPITLRLTQALENPNFRVGAACLILFILSLGATEVLYRTVERPFLVLGKKWLRPQGEATSALAPT